MRLRIFHKILLGYTLYLAIAFLFGIFVYGQIGRVVDLLQLVEIADDSKEALLELRRHEKNYIIRRDPVYLERIASVLGSLDELIASFKPDIIKAFGEDDYHSLTGYLAAYSSRMDDFGSNYRQLEALTGRLRQTGRQLEQLAIDSGRVDRIREILEIRLLEKNYVLSMEQTYFRDLTERVKTLRSYCDGDPDGIRLCDVYLELAQQLFGHNQEETRLLAAIRSSATGMEEIIYKLASRERANIGGYVVRSQHLLLGALAILALFGSMFTWFLSKALVASLQRLEATVRGIAAGETELRLEVRGDVETVSLQKSFNTMLDTLELSRESLAQTIQMLQDKSVQLIESEKLASIGILASGVAHEINNPLANISLSAETIREGDYNLEREELVELVDDILAETQRASTVVDNLLGYARSVKESGIEEHDIRGVLRQAIKLVDHEVQLHDIDLRQEVAEVPMLVKGNRGRLEQVLVNVMLNGVQAMRRGGTLSVMAAPDAANSCAVIDIVDTGPGIAPEHLSRIFDPFFTTKAAGEGTGLGLYVSYGIVQEHGGTIGVESPEAGGTLVRIRLPLVRKNDEEG